MSMLLKGDDGPEFEMGLIQDRFQVPQDGFNDSAWVTLTFRVGTEDLSWEETAPVMNLYELSNLREWLEGVANTSPEIGEVELLGPELKFSIPRDQGDSVTIRIEFTLDQRPEEYAVDAPSDELRFVDIRLSRDQVRAAAAELKRDLEATLRVPESIEGAEGEDVLWGIMGEPDADMNMMPEGYEQLAELRDEHDDIGAVDERDARRLTAAADEEEEEEEEEE